MATLGFTCVLYPLASFFFILVHFRLLHLQSRAQIPGRFLIRIVTIEKTSLTVASTIFQIRCVQIWPARDKDCKSVLVYFLCFLFVFETIFDKIEFVAFLDFDVS